MADYAMSFDGLGGLLDQRARQIDIAASSRGDVLLDADGAIAAVVAGPISMMPEEWVCPLIGVDPDDFNHDTVTFAPIAATLMDNAISTTLSTSRTLTLVLRKPDGEVDPRPWRMGFHATMRLKLSAWSDCERDRR